MESIYVKSGGIPRYCLQASADELKLTQNRRTAESSVMKHLEEALAKVQSAEQFLSCISQGDEYLKLSSQLLHQWPVENSYRLEWASAYVREKIMEKLVSEVWTTLLDRLIKKSDQAVARGVLFEVYMHHTFRKGGVKFEMKKLGESTTEKLEVIINPTVWRIRNLKELNSKELSVEDPKGTLVILDNPNFPAADFFLLPTDLFQITVSQNHPVKQHALLKVLKDLSAYKNPAAKFRLIFVVLNDIYEDYPVQKYLMKN